MITTAITNKISALPVTGAVETHQKLRLKLKPKAPTIGSVDGAWWPRSRDLAAELPALLAVLAVRLGPIERVGYHLGDWAPTVRKIRVDGPVVHLGGYRSQHADTVDVLGAKLRLTLLVIPPETTHQAAHDALMTAGHRGNTDDVEHLLTARPPTPLTERTDDEAEAAEQRWALDGGNIG
jgi:Family of unknown function (DUF5994)